MDFLAKATQQLRELYEGMTPSARIVTTLLTTAIVVSLFFLFGNETIGDAYVYGGQEFSHIHLAIRVCVHRLEDLLEQRPPVGPGHLDAHDDGLRHEEGGRHRSPAV